MANTNNKPSFFGSVVGGITGCFKGMFAGGAVGVVAGAIGGALIAAFTVGTAGLGAAALAGAFYTGVVFAGIGATAGTITGVVKSRETGQPSAQDVVNVARASYSQGVSAGMAQAQETSIHRDRLAAERAMPTQRTV